MKFSSPAFENNQLIPTTYTCEGENYSPELHFSEVPEETKSLAIIIDDPDAATDPKGTGSTFTHWLVWNIDPKTNIIEENSVPFEATEGMNGRGKIGYTGPCPPTGAHHYRFKLYALSSPLSVSQNISRVELESIIGQSLLEKAEFIGLYSMKNES